MKFFICFAILVAVVAASPAAPAPGSHSVVSSSNVQTAAANAGSALNANVQEIEPESPSSGATAAVLDLTRLRKSAGGYVGGGGYSGSSIPAPPCPNNYLFSCQPNLSPIACASPSASYGSAGSYSAPVPTYVTPVSSGSYSSLPQQYVNAYAAPQGYGYGHQNQFYQY